MIFIIVLVMLAIAILPTLITKLVIDHKENYKGRVGGLGISPSWRNIS